MTGQSAVRRAEDIGGQELSYAEVKAIASGNPAVLTLAEADAELQRLAILKKNHADEQFLARRSLRDLPATVARLEQRVAGWTEDMATAESHANDRITIGERDYSPDDALTVLSNRLKALPAEVHEIRRLPLGTYQGLSFGIILHSYGAPEVYLEGQAARHGNLARDAGARAVMNALDRIIGTYPSQLATARQELGIAEGQRRDYQARLGKPFAHDAYLTELTGLRDQLKASLSNAPPEPGADTLPPAAETADRIKALKSAHSIEPSPERTSSRAAVAAEEPVTARIRRRIDLPVAQEAAIETDVPAPPAEPPPSAAGAEDEPAPVAPAEPILLHLDEAPNAARPSATYRERVRRSDRQMSLF